MKLLLLGATGRVGSHILTHALQDGHHVTTLVRSPEKLAHKQDDNLRVLTGNVLHPADVLQAIKGADAVISTLGTDGSTTLSEGTPHIIHAMNHEGIKRIITVGTAGILQSRAEPELLRYQSSESKRKLTRAAEEHHKAFTLLEQSGLDWTIVCPTYLPDGEQVGSYRVEADFLPENGTEISVPDTAAFTYSLIASEQYMRSRVGIAY
ncbi:NAD(P)-dependent oxidoreductase [Brevibacillus choshinensis]|uniref:SDR family oxidoreductase n=1 Tax=Brevibacillus choshinensis TaxID=54911 RepID=A0ABX7FPK1_BRECH|nr:SDR family oxidoreductase [Brevibacillus choshinensis]QRG67673.1 SDR family oxidoreductase [Brevibacillus choshinensis]